MTVKQSQPYLKETLSPGFSFTLLWVPCICILLYLSSSLLLFKFGPIDWPIHNEREFWMLNTLYLSMFFVGYAIAVWRRQRLTAEQAFRPSREFTERFFWAILACALLVVLIGHRNLTMGPSYIPTTLFSDFIAGLIAPEKGYLYKLSNEAKANFLGNPPVTFLYGALSFSKLVLVYMLVSNWLELTRLQKILGLAIAIFPIISGVCVGTNKPIFDVAFTFSFLILVCALIAPRIIRMAYIKARLMLVLLTLFINLFAGSYYQHTMSARAGGLKYAESLSSNNEVIRVDPGFQKYCENSGGLVLKGCNFAATGTIYLTQGYYGMSLSTSIPLETTYGFGHSRFTIEALRKYLNVDLGPKTFQQKIDDQWSATAQWHSTYSQWANDVGFFGVALVMLALGFYTFAIWTSALTMNNAAAICSIPLLATLIFFIPANNQVFNIFESFAAFIVLFIAWIGSPRLGMPVRTTSPTK